MGGKGISSMRTANKLSEASESSSCQRSQVCAAPSIPQLGRAVLLAEHANCGPSLFCQNYGGSCKCHFSSYETGHLLAMLRWP